MLVTCCLPAGVQNGAGNQPTDSEPNPSFCLFFHQSVDRLIYYRTAVVAAPVAAEAAAAETAAVAAVAAGEAPAGAAPVGMNRISF